MRFYIHHIHEGDQSALRRIEFQLTAIQERLMIMSAELDRLTASVAAHIAKDEELVALIQNLAQQIRDNATDPAALTALADSLDEETQKETDAEAAANPAPPPTT